MIELINRLKVLLKWARDGADKSDAINLGILPRCGICFNSGNDSAIKSALYELGHCMTFPIPGYPLNDPDSTIMWEGEQLQKRIALLGELINYFETENQK